MKTLIIYMTTHGCTEKCVQKLKQGLRGDVDIYNLKNKPKLMIDTYDTVIIGGSIHAGMLQRSVKKFCTDHTKILLRKKVGLFLCCMEEGEKAEKQFNDNYPQILRDHASAKGIFGGEFIFEKMNIIAKSIVKKVANIGHSVSKISEESIKQFAIDIQK